MNNDIIVTTIHQLLLKLRNLSVSENAVLTDDLLSTLNAIFPKNLETALDLVDKQSVTCYQCPKGRKFYQVKGTTGSKYVVMATSFHCSCPTFFFACVKRQTHVICKHVLSVYVAMATKKLNFTMLSDEEFAEKLASDNEE